MAITIYPAWTPIDRQPTAVALVAPVALKIENQTAFELQVLLGPNLLEVVAPQQTKLWQGFQNLTYVSKLNWVILSPRIKERLNTPPVTGNGVIVTAFGATSDPLPPVGSYTPGNLTMANVPLHDALDAVRNGQPLNVRDFGAVADGTTDDSAAFNAAILVAGTVASGAQIGVQVRVPAGNYKAQRITMMSGVHLVGDGHQATVIRLVDGANVDLIWGGATNASFININAAYFAGNAGGLYDWSIRNLTLDGNQANQASGPSYPIRIYGYDFGLENLRITGGFSGGWQLDWNGPGIPNPHSMEAICNNVKIHDCSGIGMEWGGPQSSLLINVVIYHTTSHALKVGIHSGGLQFCNGHTWGITAGNNALAVLCESDGCVFTGNQFDGSDVVQVALLGNNEVVVGNFFSGQAAHPISAIQLGQQAGNTPYPTSAYQSAGLTTSKSCEGCTIDNVYTTPIAGANGLIWFANSFQANRVCGAWWPNNTTVSSLIGGTPAAGDMIAIAVIQANGTSSATVLYTGGEFGIGQSTTAAAIATGGTVTTLGVGVARLAPAGAVTGIILPVGRLPGQKLVVINESAFSVTFAASATSHVADGASDVIAATSAREFVWDSGTSLWYRTQ